MSRYDLEIDRDDDRGRAGRGQDPGSRPETRYTAQGRLTPAYERWERSKEAYDAARHREHSAGDGRDEQELLAVLDRTMRGQSRLRAQLREESRSTGVPYEDLLRRDVQRREAREQAWREEARQRRAGKLEVVRSGSRDDRDRDPDRRPDRRGHRREYDPRAPRRSQQDRIDATVVDVAMFRTVAYRDISERHFDGHPYTTRRGVNVAIRAGLVEQQKAKGPKGEKTFTVLTATKEGAKAAARLAASRGWDQAQRMWSERGREADIRHDVGVYRAVAAETRRLQECGYRIRRVRIDAELRSEVASRTERARSRGRDAEEAKRAAAAELELPVQKGKVVYPDAQIEYRDADNRLGRANVEMATEHYRGGSLAGKAAAGFRVYATSGRAASAVRRMLSIGGGGSRRGGRAYEVFEL